MQLRERCSFWHCGTLLDLKVLNKNIRTLYFHSTFGFRASFSPCWSIPLTVYISVSYEGRYRETQLRGGGKGLTVHRVNRLSGMTNLSSWIPGEYLELKRIKRPKSKIRSGLDFRAKNLQKGGFAKIEQNSSCLKGGVSQIRVGSRRSRNLRADRSCKCENWSEVNRFSLVGSVHSRINHGPCPPPSLNYLNIYLHIPKRFPILYIIFNH